MVLEMSERRAIATGHEPGTGMVYLVGAGPGDPGLITVAGLEALHRADVVVFDRLAAPALLREVRDGALLIDAGKASGAHTLGQEAINALLVEHGRSGRTVVRLKGGDPFLFGRGGEEALALREARVPFRIVPGVSSSLAAPAYAGIPVTHRGIAGSVLIATGHEAAADTGASFDWQAVARGADTLVFLMGVERLATIAQQLLAAGRPADQPAALVRWGSTPEQEVLIATLATIANAARTKGVRPPATLIVGDVVALRERIAWFETLPLFGMRVLVTRTQEQASGLVERLRNLGAVPLEFPAISCKPVEEPSRLDAVVQQLPEHDWAVFTSRTGVEAVFARFDALSKDARAFAATKVCAVGPATARSLADHGIRADLVPDGFSSADAAAALAARGISGRRVLLLQADIAPPTFGEQLTAAGAMVTSVAAYRTVGAEGRRAELERLLSDGLDAITFTSSSTVRHLLDTLGGDAGAIRAAYIASIGPQTSATARQAGLRVDVEAPVHTIDGLVAALTAFAGRAVAKRSATGE